MYGRCGRPSEEPLVVVRAVVSLQLPSGYRTQGQVVRYGQAVLMPKDSLDPALVGHNGGQTTMDFDWWQKPCVSGNVRQSATRQEDCLSMADPVAQFQAKTCAGDEKSRPGLWPSMRGDSGAASRQDAFDTVIRAGRLRDRVSGS